jgi:hypothetical protein
LEEKEPKKDHSPSKIDKRGHPICDGKLHVKSLYS